MLKVDDDPEDNHRGIFTDKAAKGREKTNSVESIIDDRARRSRGQPSIISCLASVSR